MLYNEDDFKIIGRKSIVITMNLSKNNDEKILNFDAKSLSFSFITMKSEVDLISNKKLLAFVFSNTLSLKPEPTGVI